MIDNFYFFGRCIQMNEFDPSECAIEEYDVLLDNPLIADDLDYSHLKTSSNDVPQEYVPCIGEYLPFGIELYILSVFVSVLVF